MLSPIALDPFYNAINKKQNKKKLNIKNTESVWQIATSHNK